MGYSEIGLLPGAAVIDAGETKTIHYLSLAILPVALLPVLVRV